MSDAIGMARGKFYGRVSEQRVLVEADGTVRVWDAVAGYYTRCHGLSKRAERRIAEEIARPGRQLRGRAGSGR